jgi:hypothetical protein
MSSSTGPAQTRSVPCSDRAPDGRLSFSGCVARPLGAVVLPGASGLPEVSEAAFAHPGGENDHRDVTQGALTP